MGRYEIKPADGSRQSRKRIGRGPGSGTGKTAGKGTKGQKSRSGYTYRAWFEGGQMPLQRRVPKRGFTNIFKVSYQVVNLDDLQRIKGDEVDKNTLKEIRLIRSIHKPVKLLGNGTIQKKYNVTVDAFSSSAREAIEAAGGTCVALKAPKKKKKLVRRMPVVAPVEEAVVDADLTEAESVLEPEIDEQEEPVTDEQEEPEVDEQEELVTNEQEELVTDEQEEPELDEQEELVTDEQEEPEVDVQKEPVIEAVESVEEVTAAEEDAVVEQETPVEEVEIPEKTKPEDEA